MAAVDNSLEHDLRAKEIKEFIESGIGVKGLLDSGVTKLPKIFIHPPENLPQLKSSLQYKEIQLQVPVIDFQGVENPHRRNEIVSEIRGAAAKWGFFQIINHGVPIQVMEDMLDGIRQFNEQTPEAKKEWYKQGGAGAGQVTFYHYMNAAPAAIWRDTLAYTYPDGNIEEEAIPQICRKATSDYVKCVIKLKNMMSGLFSEALGLNTDYLHDIKCIKSAYHSCHYYPPCPEPERTIGTRNHTDPSFLTILLQDNTGGLQVLHEDQWVDVPCIPGSLIVNFGDLMQLITNDKFKSARHRVVATAKEVSARVSSPIFFSPAIGTENELYRPLMELVSENNPPVYRATTAPAYFSHFRSHISGDGNASALAHFKLSS